MGSDAHAKACRDRNEQLLGMVCLESLGYYVRRPQRMPGTPWIVRLMHWLFGARHVVIVSDLQTIRFGLPFVLRFATSGLFPFIPAAAPRSFTEIGLSDNSSYWAQGYRALMVTDTALLRNPNYHLPSDRIETLDFDRMTRLCSQLIRTMRKMAKATTARAR
jgi:hypothetical protein